jgi:competence protein ComEA
VFDTLERYRWAIVALLALPLLVAIGVLIGSRSNGPDPLVITPGDVPPADLRVYVTGEVHNPGVYALAAGARWIDAVNAAGGALDDADLAAVNLSKRAADEDEVVVPRLGQPAPVVAGAAQSPGPVVDLNAATQADLEALPGIGQVRAQQIIQSRTTDGPFTQVEDLVLRKLVPDSVFQQIAAYITVD